MRKCASPLLSENQTFVFKSRYFLISSHSSSGISPVWGLWRRMAIRTPRHRNKNNPDKKATRAPLIKIVRESTERFRMCP